MQIKYWRKSGETDHLGRHDGKPPKNPDGVWATGVTEGWRVWLPTERPAKGG